MAMNRFLMVCSSTHIVLIKSSCGAAQSPDSRHSSLHGAILHTNKAMHF